MNKIAVSRTTYAVLERLKFGDTVWQKVPDETGEYFLIQIDDSLLAHLEASRRTGETIDRTIARLIQEAKGEA